MFSYRATCNTEFNSTANDEESTKYVLRLDSHFASTVSETILNKLAQHVLGMHCCDLLNRLQKQEKCSLSSASFQSDYQENKLKKHCSVKMLGKDSLLQKVTTTQYLNNPYYFYL